MPLDAKYDVIIIGGGHAGIEAAHAAALLGARTALITMCLEAIGRMSCNPAIGGLGKGQMVCEIDALGGLMGRAIDATGIQFRLLNMSKGPAVRAPRAQADRETYAAWVRNALLSTAGLDIIEGTVAEIVTKSRSGGPETAVGGVRLEDGRAFGGPSVVITTGTFLRGLMHHGEVQTDGGRIGEPASLGISACLERLGLTLGRLKTGTPPRVHRDSLDYSLLTPQPGDGTPVPFSFLTERIHQPQVQCWITYTNESTHRVIRDNLHRAPMYTGQIQAAGPRYCPSIEDKVVRFADKPRHQLFLEPEGYDNERVYCNGISTSLPVPVQEELVSTIPGLQRAHILQHGYAVEYDSVPTHQIGPSLETKRVAGLFLAGQINGTSGYEEAAGQGLIAGINAVRSLSDQDPVVLGRDQAYIGVMIDDLVTRPPSEPYRMFTSRAEHRLHLRADNADQRLTPLGRDCGLVQDDRWQCFEQKQEQIRRLSEIVPGLRWDGCPLSQWLRRPESDLDGFRQALRAASAEGAFGEPAMRQVQIQARYGGYLVRQERQIERYRRLESTPIPANVDYGQMSELRLEARERLARLGPRTLGQATRISGINPADITVLWVYLTGRRACPRRP
jgi:tRNA uridine 5-carboxymethylaminomethyl modification enzyme